MKGSGIIWTALLLRLALANGQMEVWMKEDQNLLQSEQCSSYMEHVYANMGRLLEHDDEDLIDFACRPSLAVKQDRLRALTAKPLPEPDECRAADQRLVRRDLKLLQEALVSASACEEAVESEIDFLYESDSSPPLLQKQQALGLSPLERQIRFAGTPGNLPVMRFVANCCGTALPQREGASS